MLFEDSLSSEGESVCHRLFVDEDNLRARASAYGETVMDKQHKF